MNVLVVVENSFFKNSNFFSLNPVLEFSRDDFEMKTGMKFVKSSPKILSVRKALSKKVGFVSKKKSIEQARTSQRARKIWQELENIIIHLKKSKNLS